MNKITFKKGIKRINFPVHSSYAGEMLQKITEIQTKYSLPKYRKIGIERIICVDKQVQYDITQVFIEK